MTNKQLLTKFTQTIMQLMVADGTEKELKLQAIADELEREILNRMQGCFKFEVGCVYTPYAREFEPIRVISRTEKTITAQGVECGVQWRMRVRTDEDGNEFAVDSKVPQKWRTAFTYGADDRIDWDNK